MMHTKTRNIVVGGSYASTIFLSYIGLLFYNSQYQAINTGYILVFCLFEAFFLRIAIGPIIVPANPQPKPNKVSMSQNLFRQQETEKNYFNQNNTIKIDTGSREKTIHENIFSKQIDSPENPNYLMDQKNMLTFSSVNTKTKILTPAKEQTVGVQTCSTCQANIPGNTKNLTHCPFCNTILTKPNKNQRKDIPTQKEKLPNKPDNQESLKEVPRQTVKEIFHTKIHKLSLKSLTHPHTYVSKDNQIEKPQEPLLGQENEVSKLRSNRKTTILEQRTTTGAKDDPLRSKLSPDDRLLFDRLNQVTERLEQKRQEIEQKHKENSTKNEIINFKTVVGPVFTEQNIDKNIDIACVVCKKVLHWHLSSQNVEKNSTGTEKPISLFQIPNGYSLACEHVSQQTEEMHQLSLVFNKNLDLLSQEVTIVPATIQNVQQIDKTKNEDPAELFLKELKYPCRLCRKEFTLGDQYIATKYELTQHTEIVHIRTVHQANDQTGRHEAVIKVDFSQKILLNMPEINILGSKPEHFNENTLVLATP